MRRTRPCAHIAGQAPPPEQLVGAAALPPVGKHRRRARRSPPGRVTISEASERAGVSERTLSRYGVRLVVWMVAAIMVLLVGLRVTAELIRVDAAERYSEQGGTYIPDGDDGSCLMHPLGLRPLLGIEQRSQHVVGARGRPPT